MLRIEPKYATNEDHLKIPALEAHYKAMDDLLQLSSDANKDFQKVIRERWDAHDNETDGLVVISQLLKRNLRTIKGLTAADKADFKGLNLKKIHQPRKKKKPPTDGETGKEGDTPKK